MKSENKNKSWNHAIQEVHTCISKIHSYIRRSAPDTDINVGTFMIPTSKRKGRNVRHWLQHNLLFWQLSVFIGAYLINMTTFCKRSWYSPTPVLQLWNKICLNQYEIFIYLPKQAIKYTYTQTVQLDLMTTISYPMLTCSHPAQCQTADVSYTRACETSAGCLRSIYPSLGLRQLFGDVTMGQWRHN